MAQSTNSHTDASNPNAAVPAELSRNEALALLRLLSPQACEHTHFSASVLNTPNGGQLYVTPHLYG